MLLIIIVENQLILFIQVFFKDIPRYIMPNNIIITKISEINCKGKD